MRSLQVHYSTEEGSSLANDVAEPRPLQLLIMACIVAQNEIIQSVKRPITCQPDGLVKTHNTSSQFKQLEHEKLNFHMQRNWSEWIGTMSLGEILPQLTDATRNASKIKISSKKREGLMHFLRLLKGKILHEIIKVYASTTYALLNLS